MDISRLLPEEKIANRFIKRLNLSPPVNVLELVKSYADFEEDNLPGEVDALCIQRKSDKPLVILDALQASKRKRFTLAHELGHLIIPWHTGTMICHTEGHLKYDDYSYTQIEAEANRFASELLMPSYWVQDVIESNTDMKDIISEVYFTAEVSIFAALIAIAKNLPIGHLILLTKERTILNYYKSPETKVEVRRFEDIKHTASLASDFGAFTLESYDIVWFKFNSFKKSVTIRDTREAKVILREIVASSIKKEEQTTYIQRINGIFGAANGSRKSKNLDRDEFCLLLQQRIASHPHLSPIVSHTDFNNFFSKKVSELFGE